MEIALENNIYKSSVISANNKRLDLLNLLKIRKGVRLVQRHVDSVVVVLEYPMIHRTRYTSGNKDMRFYEHFVDS